MSSADVKVDAPAPPAAASASRPAWRQVLGCPCCWCAPRLAVYIRVDRYHFVNYDDTLYVTQNAHVQAGLDMGRPCAGHLPRTTSAHWHPVTWLSHALDCQFFDLDAAGPHDVNLLLHLLNACCCSWSCSARPATSAAASWWRRCLRLHPINVESVVWIAERKNSLSMLFFLLALGAYGWYAQKPKAGATRVVALLFALGLMAKPQVITFPFVLLLWDYWPLRRCFSLFALRCSPEWLNREFWRKANGEWRTALAGWEKLPLFALAGVSAAITMAAQRADGNKMLYPLLAAAGVRHRLVCAVHREGVVAGAIVAVLSPSRFCCACGKWPPRRCFLQW